MTISGVDHVRVIKSLVFAVIMVPVVMAIITGLIYGLGEVFNIFLVLVKKTSPDKIIDSLNARLVGHFLSQLPFLPIFFFSSTSQRLAITAGKIPNLPLY